MTEAYLLLLPIAKWRQLFIDYGILCAEDISAVLCDLNNHLVYKAMNEQMSVHNVAVNPFHDDA